MFNVATRKLITYVAGIIFLPDTAGLELICCLRTDLPKHKYLDEMKPKADHFSPPTSPRSQTSLLLIFMEEGNSRK